MIDTNTRTVAMSHLIAVYLILLAALLINGYYGFGYPLTHYLIGLERFDDFYNSISLARVLPAADSSYIMSPGAMFIFRMIHGAIADLAFAAYNALILYLVWSALGDFRLARSQKIGLLLTYPILFGLCRGNQEIVAFALLLKSLGQWHQGHHRAALALLLVSIYIKPTTAIWLAVFPVKELLKEGGCFFGYLRQWASRFCKSTLIRPTS